MSKRIRRSDEEIRDAVEAVINQNLSVRKAAKDTGISKSLLADLVKRFKNDPDNNFTYVRNIGNQKTFTTDQEKLLVSYLKITSKMCFGLTTIQTREPLDVAVYGPFKSRYKQAMNNWLTCNPGKTVTLYEVAEFVNPAFSESFKISTIYSGFQKTGIYPCPRPVETLQLKDGQNWD
ncbi:CENP-B N-terminal DNA-binding domain [Popillia japonica]|uniref:CENP-B N-terminal DNA-binding domain n=1 Tax=Popillia japonica TaxID=7064 RepID=A0AAW1JJ32_POPJA